MIKVRDLFRDTSSTEFVIVTIPTVIAYLSFRCYLNNNLLSTFLQMHDSLTNNFVKTITPSSIQLLLAHLLYWDVPQ